LIEGIQMIHEQSPGDGELRGIVDEKLTALVGELEDANWRADEIAFMVEAVLKEKWLNQAEALRTTRDTVPTDFVSDGNEG
jgi:hypothetical protein